MKPWPKVSLGEAVTQAARAEAPMAGTTYRQIGVKTSANTIFAGEAGKP